MSRHDVEKLQEANRDVSRAEMASRLTTRRERRSFVKQNATREQRKLKQKNGPIIQGAGMKPSPAQISLNIKCGDVLDRCAGSPPHDVSLDLSGAVAAVGDVCSDLPSVEEESEHGVLVTDEAHHLDAEALSGIEPARFAYRESITLQGDEPIGAVVGERVTLTPEEE